jgi:ribonuclease P protein subunit RPR2
MEDVKRIERLISLNVIVKGEGSPKMVDTATKRIAIQRVKTLFCLAKNIFNEDPPLAQRYVDTARKVAMAARIRLPTEYRRMICRHCKSFILPGVNCRVRVKQRREPHVIITCLNCGKHMRIPIKKRKEKIQCVK